MCSNLISIIYSEPAFSYQIFREAQFKVHLNFCRKPVSIFNNLPDIFNIHNRLFITVDGYIKLDDRVKILKGTMVQREKTANFVAL